MMVFDLDETLLNQKNVVSPITLKTLYKIKKFGYKLMITTGKALLTIKVYAQKFHLMVNLYFR